MKGNTTYERMIERFKAVYERRIQYCRGAFEVVGRPLQFQVILNNTAHEAEKNLKVSEAMKPLAILQVQANQAEIAMLKMWDELQQ